MIKVLQPTESNTKSKFRIKSKLWTERKQAKTSDTTSACARVTRRRHRAPQSWPVKVLQLSQNHGQPDKSIPERSLMKIRHIFQEKNDERNFYLIKTLKSARLCKKIFMGVWPANAKFFPSETTKGVLQNSNNGTLGREYGRSLFRKNFSTRNNLEASVPRSSACLFIVTKFIW